MLSVLGCAQKRKLHLLWLLSPSPLYWAKDIFQAHMFRFFPIGFWFYPESHTRERGVSQIPDYAQECINSSKHLLPGLLIRPCLSFQVRTVPVWSNASTVKAAQGGTPPHHWILIDRQVLAKPGSSCARAALLTTEALEPLFHLISTRAMIQKLSSFMRSPGNDSLNACISDSWRGLLPYIGCDKLKHLPLFLFPCCSYICIYDQFADSVTEWSINPDSFQKSTHM